MWKAVQTIGIFKDDDKELFEDGSNPVSKKLKGSDGTWKILKISADTGKTLRRRKVLTKAVKKQITKHIRELNPMNILLLSYRYISTCKWHRRSRALKTIQFIGAEDPGHSKQFSSSTPAIFP